MAPSQNSSIIWRIRLFDGPVLESSSGEEVTRFRSLKIGALLSYLALRTGHPCPREEIYYAIWPEEDDIQVVANRLRVALNSLRRQLEPPGVPFGAVLDVSDRTRIRLRADTVWCDVVAFEGAIKSGRREEASQIFRGTLLPGYYDSWVIHERERLQTLGAELTPAQNHQKAAEPPPPTLRKDTAVPQQYPLPLYLTRYFGREDEKEQLHTLICGNRLITITGPGGMGKTRLAVETARKVPLPSVFAALADISKEEQIPEAILHALRIKPAVGADLLDQLIGLFRRRESTLLILDNAEHLHEGTAATAFKLLEAVPDLTILVTSRHRLNIAGESLLQLSALESPPSNNPFEALLQMPSIALFLDRAKNARPDITFSERHSSALTKICDLLEGVPLALELAAARVICQSASQIADSLEKGLLQLKSQQHSLSSRHRSLRVTIQGSYDLLTPELQRFLAELSVFQDGWTLESARFVTGCAETESFLEELAMSSLLVTRENEDTGELRYAFLESIRQFASEQLFESDRESITQRHAEYFLTTASRVTEDDIRTFAPLDSEQQNMLLALETGWAKQDTLFTLGLTGFLICGFSRGNHRVSLPWAERARTIVDQIPDINTRIRMRFACYMLFSYAGDMEVVSEIGQEIERDAEENDDDFGRIHARVVIGYMAHIGGDFESSFRLMNDALGIAKRSGDKMLICRCNRVLAWFHIHYATAKEGLSPEQVTEELKTSDSFSMGCLSLMPPHSSHSVYARLTLTYSLRYQGRMEESYKWLKEAQEIAVRQGVPTMLIFSFNEEANQAIEAQQYEYAAVFYGGFLGLRERTGYNHDVSHDREDQPRITLTAHLGKERYESLAQRGGKMPPNELVAMRLTAPPSFP